jgi:hypothetical protein
MASPVNRDLALEPMASGHVCLRLSESVTWKDFPDFAKRFIDAVGGRVIAESDAADMRLWEVEVDRCRLRLVYEDYPSGVSLESTDDAGDAVLRALKARLERRP